jgi:hypothetical protein
VLHGGKGGGGSGKASASGGGNRALVAEGLGHRTARTRIAEAISSELQNCR